MHASKGRKYYACTEKRSQKRREIMVTITRRDLCRLALLSLMVAFDGRSYTPPTTKVKEVRKVVRGNHLEVVDAEKE